MTAKQLKNSILKEAFEGKLTIPSLKNSVKAKNKIDLNSAHGDDNLPKGWEIKTLEEVCIYSSSNIALKDIKNKKGNYPVYGASGVVGYVDFYSKEKECVAVVKDGSIGKVFLLPAKSSVISTLHYLENTEILNIEYLYYFLQSLNLMKYKVGSMIPHIYFRDYKKETILIPPIEEQKRIVNKLNELMPLIEEYEKLENKLNELDKKFPERLKKSILKEAVCGRLVSQNKEDEPASELLKRIRAEREKLIKEKKIKADKTTSIIYRKGNSYCEERDGREICIDDEIPFEIPNSWEWVRLFNISKTIIAGGDKPSNFSKFQTKKFSIPVLSNGEKDCGLFGYTDIPKITEPSITVSGRGTIGFSCVRRYPYTPIVRLICIIPLDVINIDYLEIVLTTLLEKGVGTSIKQLTVPMLSPKLIPLPPLEEQKRIVKKLKKLVNLCEKMTK